MDNTIPSKTLYGLKWSYASTLTNAVMQIRSTAIMVMLLEPKTFALVGKGRIILSNGCN